MTEKKQQLIEASKLIFVLAFAFLYAWGGIEHKWLRRFLAPAILCLGMFTYTRDWRTFFTYPLLCASLCLGYGGNAFIIKLFRRVTFAFSTSVASVSYHIIPSLRHPILWWLVGLHIFLITLTIPILGIINPLPHARTEEFAIGFLLAFFPMLMCDKQYTQTSSTLTKEA